MKPTPFPRSYPLSIYTRLLAIHKGVSSSATKPVICVTGQSIIDPFLFTLLDFALASSFPPIARSDNIKYNRASGSPDPFRRSIKSD
jgi:hypothetical protein